MTVTGTDKATVRINNTAIDGTEDADFSATATVIDTDGDGKAPVFLDTGSLGDGPADDAFSAGDGAEVTNKSQTDLGKRLQPDQYPVAITTDGKREDAGILVVNEAVTEDNQSATDTGDGGSNTTGTEGTATDGGDEIPGFGISTALVGIVISVVFALRTSPNRD
ncbi:hypothetical protein [Natrinema sp. 74]|uniref:hypothetical protein n=1 Tax=Natrinema sp. 74 TaxID=3384159 RepID=UPI0038D49971